MKVDIKHWRGVATWHWLTDIDELCGICRVAFDDHCPSCRYPGGACPVVFGGACLHNFHFHCIIKWLEEGSSKGLCPMCRQVFVLRYVEGVGSREEVEQLQELEFSHRAARELFANMTAGIYEQQN